LKTGELLEYESILKPELPWSSPIAPALVPPLENAYDCEGEVDTITVINKNNMASKGITLHDKREEAKTSISSYKFQPM
jgi:hypothetical protein